MSKKISRRDVLKTIGLTSLAATTLMNTTSGADNNVINLKPEGNNPKDKDFDKPLTSIIIGAGIGAGDILGMLQNFLKR